MLSHINVFPQLGRAGESESAQCVAAGGNRCWERTLCHGNDVVCCPVVHSARYSHGTSSHQKRNPKIKSTRRNFVFACSSESVTGKKPNLKHFLLRLISFRAAVDFSILFPKRISFDNTVPENPFPAVSGKLTGTAGACTQNAGACPIHAAR